MCPSFNATEYKLLLNIHAITNFVAKAIDTGKAVVGDAVNRALKWDGKDTQNQQK